MISFLSAVREDGMNGILFLFFACRGNGIKLQEGGGGLDGAPSVAQFCIINLHQREDE